MIRWLVEQEPGKVMLMSVAVIGWVSIIITHLVERARGV